jgi:hypothetical protein
MNNNLINSPKLVTDSTIGKEKELSNANKSQGKSSESETILGSEFNCSADNQVNSIPYSSLNINRFSSKSTSGESEDDEEIEKPGKVCSKSKKSSKFDLDDDVIEDYLNNISDKEDLFSMAKLSSTLNLKSDDDNDNSSDDYEDIDELNLSKSKGIYNIVFYIKLFINILF